MLWVGEQGAAWGAKVLHKGAFSLTRFLQADHCKETFQDLKIETSRTAFGAGNAANVQGIAVTAITVATVRAFSIDAQLAWKSFRCAHHS